jgi:hypothetical protein
VRVAFATFLFALSGGWLAAQAQPAASASPNAAASAPIPPPSAISEQIASVRQQAGIDMKSPGALEDPFFTVPWPTPPPLPSFASADCDPVPAKDLTTMINNEAQKQGVKADLIHAVIDQESGGKACAVSSKGALGLMQLMPDKAAELGVKDPFDPAQSLEGGVKYLRQLLNKYHGDTALALGAYNAGENRVDQTGAVPKNPETQNYVESIQNKLSPGVGGVPQRP